MPRISNPGSVTSGDWREDTEVGLGVWLEGFWGGLKELI